MPALAMLDGQPLEHLAGSALAVTYDATISASTEITLNAATKAIEVTALAQAIFLSWGTDDASSTNFDHVIPAGQTRVFKVPPNTTAVNFIEQATSAVLAVAEY